MSSPGTQLISWGRAWLGGIVVLAMTAGCGSGASAPGADSPPAAGPTSAAATEVGDDSWWWGVTVDDPTEIDAIVGAVEALPVRPVVRMVFDVDRLPDSYLDEVRRLASVSTVMGLVADSAEVAGLSEAQYRQRFESYVTALGTWIPLWEIGNEINGEWLGPASEVSSKIQAADRVVRQHGREPVLTLYDNQGCAEDPRHDMLTWVERELDPVFRGSVPIVLLSHYPDHCSGGWPADQDWQSTFERVGALFPRARWGIGETGVVDADGEDAHGQIGRKTALIDSCYRMSVPDPRYLGGCFWWYFAEDAVPSADNAIWSAMAAAMADGPPR